MRPPGKTWRRAASVLIAVLVAVSSLVFGALPAHAGSHRVGYDEGLGFLGAYSTDFDGRQSGDPNLTSAVALFVWSVADPGGPAEYWRPRLLVLTVVVRHEYLRQHRLVQTLIGDASGAAQDA
jgi:hypothetical protein